MFLDFDMFGLLVMVIVEGISVFDYQIVLDIIIGYFQQIYGSDVYFDLDSKDGQMVVLVVLVIYDVNNMVIFVYWLFFLLMVLDDVLISNVKINGIICCVVINFMVDELIEGEVGMLIINGFVKDVNGIIWNFFVQVIIGIDGMVIVIVMCFVVGVVVVFVGLVNKINILICGWVLVINL